jgi:hypothetical protein
MSYSVRRWTMLILATLSIGLLGQTCGVVNGGGGGGGGGGGDPLAPLVPRTCGIWSGRLTGTLHRVKTQHIGCPWSDGTVDVEDQTTDELHTSDYTVSFIDVWGGDPVVGYRCAPTGTSAKPVSAEGTVEYTRSWVYDHDWGDSCRSHHSTEDDTFMFNVDKETISASVEVHPLPYTYTAQQALLAERPCREEYPIMVMITVSSPSTGGTGTHAWTDRSVDNCPACDGCPVPGALETNGTEAVDSNSAASYTAILYGTYRMDAAEHDTIEASYKHSALADPQPDNRCPGLNEEACSGTCTDLVSEDYTLTLTRAPDGDRDMDGECDSVDPCPDDAWEIECDNAP